MLVTKFQCLKCRSKLQISRELVRPKVRCPACGSQFRAPRGRTAFDRKNLPTWLLQMTYRGSELVVLYGQEGRRKGGSFR